MATDRRKNPARKKTAIGKTVVWQYHVGPNGKRLEIERDRAATGSFAYEVNTAIGLATAEASRDVQNGLDATVCVEDQYGCRHVWP